MFGIFPATVAFLLLISIGIVLVFFKTSNPTNEENKKIKILAPKGSIDPRELLLKDSPQKKISINYSVSFYRTVSITTLIVGILFFIWGNVSYRIIDSSSLWKVCFFISLPIILAVVHQVYECYKKSSVSMSVSVQFLITFSLGLLFLTRYGGAVLNGLLDLSSPQRHEQMSVEKYISTSKGTKYYHIAVEPWNKMTRYVWRFSVPKNIYDQTEVNTTHFNVVTRSGRFGFEWVVSQHIINKNSKENYFYDDQRSTSFSKYFIKKDFSRWNLLPHLIQGMNPDEFIYWQKWRSLVEDGISNRMNVQEALDKHLTANEYAEIYQEYRNRQENVLEKFKSLQPPERLIKFHSYVIDATTDQIKFYQTYSFARIQNPNRKFGEFRANENLVASDQKLWAAYHNFESLYPSRNKATNDAVEQCLAWFDIV